MECLPLGSQPLNLFNNGPQKLDIKGKRPRKAVSKPQEPSRQQQPPLPSQAVSTPIAPRSQQQHQPSFLTPSFSKLEVYNDTVMASAAAILNAKLKQLQDKENIPPPNSPAPVRFTGHRSSHARPPLTVLAVRPERREGAEAGEDGAEEENNDGHYVILESQWAPLPGEEEEDDDGTDKSGEDLDEGDLDKQTPRKTPHNTHTLKTSTTTTPRSALRSSIKTSSSSTFSSAPTQLCDPQAPRDSPLAARSHAHVTFKFEPTSSSSAGSSSLEPSRSATAGTPDLSLHRLRLRQRGAAASSTTDTASPDSCTSVSTQRSKAATRGRGGSKKKLVLMR